ALWERNNDMIISWVLNTVTDQISNNLSSVHSASALWKELQQHNSQLDGHRIYQLANEITQMKQTNCFIEMYYQKLKGLRDEVDALEAPYMCTCTDGRLNGEREGRKRLLQFLMGLDECFSNIRVGHPLHGKFKPGNSGQNRTTNFKQRAVNMVTGHSVGQETNGGGEARTSRTKEDDAVFAKMNSLQNQLNQVMLMLQNSQDMIDPKLLAAGRFDVFFRNQLLVFQQHQDESLYYSWTRFKDIIQKVPNHGLSICTLIEIFLKHLDSLSRHINILIAEGDLRKFIDIGAWYAIEDYVRYDKKRSNPTCVISDEIIANLNAQTVRDNMVRVQVPRCIAWLNYDEHVDSLSKIDNEVGVTSLESTIQTLASFEEYTPPVTYPEEVKKTLGTPIEVEPLNEIKLEKAGLNYNHNTPFSFSEVSSFDGPEPQPLLNSPSLDVSLKDIIGPEPPIKPHSPDSSRMKVVEYLTTQTPPSPHVENSHPKGVYSYYNLESKEVSPLGEKLSLFDRPNEVERGRILEAHSQRMALSHHDGDLSSKTFRFHKTWRRRHDLHATPSPQYL
nr:cysteine-rich RLK (receptor-like protein kinase) 8 [Tanacetum cinerariifolium]